MTCLRISIKQNGIHNRWEGNIIKKKFFISCCEYKTAFISNVLGDNK